MGSGNRNHEKTTTEPASAAAAAAVETEKTTRRARLGEALFLRNARPKWVGLHIGTLRPKLPPNIFIDLIYSFYVLED